MAFMPPALIAVYCPRRRVFGFVLFINCLGGNMNARVDFHLTPSPFEKKYEQIETRFDPDLATAWTYMKPAGAPCFNLGMLEELRAHDSAIESCGGRLIYDGELREIHYYVGASR